MLIISTVLAAAALFGAWGLRSGDLAAVEHTKGATTTGEAQQLFHRTGAGEADARRLIPFERVA